jgi:hypothetical protein
MSLDVDQETVFRFLDDVRKGGKINMLGSSPYVSQMFGVKPIVARALVAEWMRTFAVRHPQEGA